MLTYACTTVYISKSGSNWVELKGYAGGLSLGMSTEKVQRNGDDDGIARYFKGNSAGSESQIAFRKIEGDAGQELIKELGGLDSEGFGFVRIDYPQGGSVSAEGLFHGVLENPIEGDQFQGYVVNFTQNEPEEYT